MFTRLACIASALAAAALGLDLPSEPAHDLIALDKDRAVERRLARGEDHRYALTLTKGEYASVVVEQRGIDAVVELRTFDDNLIAEVQDEIRSWGEEHLGVVADATGAYIIVIKAAPGAIAPGAYAIRVASRRTATQIDRTLEESRKLRTAAVRFEREGKFETARTLLERALTITEAVKGPDDIDVAAITVQLAGVYRRLPDAIKSESLYVRAIAVMDRTLGSENPSTAFARSQLAVVYEHEGERRKAEALLRQSLDAIGKALGADHPWFASCLATLGNLRDDAGDLDEEEAIIQRALRIIEKINANSDQYASLLNNLGEVYRQKQDYARAEELFQQSLDLGERLLGPDNYTIATALQNLGIVARERKDYAKAIAYNTRALAIRERMVGPDHPDVAHILTNLANIYRATGDYARSLATHFQALRIWENAAGPYQQGTLLSVGNIAKTYAASGDMAQAIAFQQRADAIVEKALGLNLATGSERQKLAFARSVAERTDRTISLHLEDAPDDPAAADLAALVLLQRKGRVLDAMADTFAAVRQRVPDATDQRLLDQLTSTTASLAHLALSPSSTMRADDRRRALKDLEVRKEQLEEQLSEHSAELRAQMQPVTLAAVQRAIPEDAALLEFAVFRPFDPTAERNTEAYGPSHYAAYVVRRHGTPRGIDLGETSIIDERIETLRQALRDPDREDVKVRARTVDRLVMQPLRRSLADAARLIICPDGELNLVPFEALVDEQGTYLIERYATSYLTSGRDLLRMQVPRATSGKTVVLADPLFGEPDVPHPVRPLQKKTSPQTARRGATMAEDLSSVYFAPLAGTADEARAIKSLFPEAVLFTRERATKSVLQRLDGPRILHIASHGFFLKDVPPEVAEASAENPLLRSGLALAGANLTRGGHSDGILTALEASSLNLWGTRLVTLSACDTGIGEVRNGEGVYGLRRALVLAGAETVVMSLWPVSDSIARETMVTFYSGLRAGLGRGDALRQAKLTMLKRRARQHPFFWASFIQSGEWAGLDGAR